MSPKREALSGNLLGNPGLYFKQYSFLLVLTWHKFQSLATLNYQGSLLIHRKRVKALYIVSWARKNKGGYHLGKGPRVSNIVYKNRAGDNFFATPLPTNEIYRA
jgi:hypothetical protein